MTLASVNPQPNPILFNARMLLLPVAQSTRNFRPKKTAASAPKIFEDTPAALLMRARQWTRVWLSQYKGRATAARRREPAANVLRSGMFSPFAPRRRRARPALVCARMAHRRRGAVQTGAALKLRS